MHILVEKQGPKQSPVVSVHRSHFNGGAEHSQQNRAVKSACMQRYRKRSAAASFPKIRSKNKRMLSARLYSVFFFCFAGVNFYSILTCVSNAIFLIPSLLFSSTV